MFVSLSLSLSLLCVYVCLGGDVLHFSQPFVAGVEGILAA
jgi:hypothetical protein